MVEILIDYDGDAGPCDDIHEIAGRYDISYALIGHELSRNMTLTADREDIAGLERAQKKRI